MAATQEELETELHRRYDAAQAAQLFEEEDLISHSEGLLEASEGRRDDVREELVGILQDRFDDQREREFAFLLMTEAYAAGLGP